MTTSELVADVGRRHGYTKKQIHEMRMRLRTYFMFRATEPYSSRYLFDTSYLLSVNEELFNLHKKHAYFYTLYLHQCQEEVRFYLGYTLHKIVDVCDTTFEDGALGPKTLQTIEHHFEKSKKQNDIFPRRA